MHPLVTKTNTIPGELHQIEAYVRSLNTRIQHLSECLEQSLITQIAEIREGLKSARKGLTKLQTTMQSPILEGLIKDVGSARMRLRKLDKQLWDVSTLPQDREEAPAVEGTLAAESVRWSRVISGETRRQSCESASVPAKYYMSGALPAHADTEILDDGDSRNELSQVVSCKERREKKGDSNDDNETCTAPNGRVDAAIEPYSRQTTRRTSGTANSSTTERPWRKKRVLAEEPSPRAVVMTRLLVEEFSDSDELQDPDRVREGSTSGLFCAADIIAGIHDDRCVRPELAFLKVHEIRSLKRWLTAHRYLRRSETISRIEKLLHLIFALQDGCRFEKIAVWFSRSPRQVYDSCEEVFHGLLELHSETMLPKPYKHPVYRRLWKITDAYATMEEFIRASKYYPWDALDLRKVIVTINYYVGRYRSQGCEALTGPHFNWGKFLHLNNANYEESVADEEHHSIDATEEEEDHHNTDEIEEENADDETLQRPK